jgi:cobalamin biosynthesis protein CobD/CbiB
MPLAIGIDPSHYAVVSAMITPAFFLTATSSLIATSNARLSRVVDRMRVDIAELQRLDHPVVLRELRLRVDEHRKRSRLVLAAVRLLYGAVTAFVGTSMAIAIDSVIGWHIDALPMLLAVLGVLLVLLASLCLGREAKMALTMLEADLDRQLASRGAGPENG